MTLEIFMPNEWPESRCRAVAEKWGTILEVKLWRGWHIERSQFWFSIYYVVQLS